MPYPSSTSVSLSVGCVRVNWGLCLNTHHYLFWCEEFASGKWVPLEGSTFTTGLPEDTEFGVVLAASRRIIEILEEKGVGYLRKPAEYAPALELISWMDPEHFTERYVLEEQTSTWPRN
jgi:hypothetical protein